MSAQDQLLKDSLLLVEQWVLRISCSKTLCCWWAMSSQDQLLKDSVAGRKGVTVQELLLKDSLLLAEPCRCALCSVQDQVYLLYCNTICYLQGHVSRISCLSLSQSGTLLLSGSDDRWVRNCVFFYYGPDRTYFHSVVKKTFNLR